MHLLSSSANGNDETYLCETMHYYVFPLVVLVAEKAESRNADLHAVGCFHGDGGEPESAG